jgi:hypothetical protein
MGGNDTFSINKLCYLITTTCNTSVGAPHFFFSKKTYPFFARDCYLYFNEPVLSMNPDTVKKDGNVVLVGKIANDDLKKIYQGVLTSTVYSKMVKKDIHSSLNRLGIVGLRRPA